MGIHFVLSTSSIYTAEKYRTPNPSSVSKKDGRSFKLLKHGVGQVCVRPYDSMYRLFIENVHSVQRAGPCRRLVSLAIARFRHATRSTVAKHTVYSIKVKRQGLSGGASRPIAWPQYTSFLV